MSCDKLIIFLSMIYVSAPLIFNIEILFRTPVWVGVETYVFLSARLLTDHHRAQALLTSPDTLMLHHVQFLEVFESLMQAAF